MKTGTHNGTPKTSRRVEQAEHNGRHERASNEVSGNQDDALVPTLIRDAIEGAIAGFGATVPMTALMQIAFDALPLHERYALPPRQITSTVVDKTGLWSQLSESQRQAVTLAAHFGYGSTMGAGYGALVRESHRNSLTGAAYGMAVWAGSYLGLLPSLDILPPATDHPARRNALMIGAHLVWGAALGCTMELMKKRAQDEHRA